MGIEIERKFLVTGDSWRQQAQRSLEMRQGYLAGEGGRASIRVRLEGTEARLNIKAAVIGAVRAEYEYPMPPEDARKLLETLCVGTLEKVRYYIEREGLTWEVDEFLGANSGLVVAEIELDSIEQPFSHPEWLGRELTDDRRYYNHHLAIHPYSTWPDADRH
jgi:adenylate cyclase